LCLQSSGQGAGLAPLVEFYSKLPKGPAPTRAGGGIKARFFNGKNASAAPFYATILTIFGLGYTIDYQSTSVSSLPRRLLTVLLLSPPSLVHLSESFPTALDRTGLIVPSQSTTRTTLTRYDVSSWYRARAEHMYIALHNGHPFVFNFLRDVLKATGACLAVGGPVMVEGLSRPLVLLPLSNPGPQSPWSSSTHPCTSYFTSY
jgi:hypothetical protein